MDQLEPVAFPNWARRDLIDILSHHVCPSLWLNRDSLVCRLVCSSWREAFAARALKVNPTALATSRETITASARLVRRLTVVDADSVLLQWLRDDVVLSPGGTSNLTSLILKTSNMSIEDAAIIAKIFANLKQSRLRSVTLSTSGVVLDDVFRLVVNALADTEAPIRDLDLSDFRTKPSTASDFFSALLRGPKTLRKIQIRKSDYMVSVIPHLLAFVHDNRHVKKMAGYGLLDGDEPDLLKLSDHLAVDNQLEYLDFGGCGSLALARLAPCLRTNRALRKLSIGSYDLQTSAFVLIIDCLCENESIQKLGLDLGVEVSDIASNLNRLFVERRSPLRHFRLECHEKCQEDFSSLFQGGIRMNTTLTHLTVSRVPLNFIVHLAECIIDSNGLKSLEMLSIEYASLDNEAALMLSTAAACLPRLTNFELFVVECGPDAAEPFAKTIEKSHVLEIVSFYSTGFGSAGLIRICDAVLKSRSPISEIALGGEQHSEEALLAVCNMVAKKTSLEYLDFSGTRMPAKLRPDFEAALMQNDKMYRMEVMFVKEDNEGERGSIDLKYELVQAFFNQKPKL